MGYAGQDRQNRTLAFPPAEWLWALKPDFHCGWEKKREFALFFFRARRFRFFSRFFFFALSRSYFAFALASAKARKKRQRPPLVIIYSVTYSSFSTSWPFHPSMEGQINHFVCQSCFKHGQYKIMPHTKNTTEADEQWLGKHS